MNKYIPLFTSRFINDTKKLKKDLHGELEKAVYKIIENPERGKPLRYSFKGLRTLRVSEFRIIYEIDDNKVIFYTFEHRKKIYK